MSLLKSLGMGALIFVIGFFIAACGHSKNVNATTHHSSDDDTLPIDDDVSPIDDDASPADDDASPADDDVSPADDDASPADDDSSPADDDATPTPDYLKPLTLVDEPDRKIELIAGGLPNNKGMDLAVGSDSTMYVALIKGRMLFVYRVGVDGAVARERVAAFASEPAIVRDAAGVLHLLFVDTSAETLVYANNRNGQWSFSKVTDATVDGYSGIYFKLAVDNAGVAHVAYVPPRPDVHQPVVWYAENSAGAWSAEIAVQGKNIDSYAMDLAVTSDGTPHLGYSLDDKMTHAVRRNGVWRKTKIPAPTGNINIQAISIAIDKRGAPRMAFEVVNSGDGMDYYASFTAGEGWSMETIGGDVVPYLQKLILDSQGEPTIAIDNDPLTGPRSIERMSRQKGVWTAETVYSADPGQYMFPEISFDSSGQVAAVFRTGPITNPVINAGELSVISKIGGTWRVRPVEEANGPRLENASLAIDAAGQLRVLFEVDDPSQVPRAWLARGGFGNWSYESLDFGQWGALAIDSQQHNHLALFDTSKSRVRYMTDRRGVWSSEDLPPSEETYPCNLAIALNAADVPGIAVAVWPTPTTLSPGIVGILGYYERQANWSYQELGMFHYTSENRLGLVFAGNDPRIAYYNYDEESYYVAGSLLHFSRTGDEWREELLAGGQMFELAGSNTALTIDKNGIETLLYADEARQPTVSTGVFGSWTSQEISSSFNLTQYYYSAIAPDGEDIVAAIAGPNLAIRHDGVWSFRAVDEGVDYGEWGMSLAIAPDGWIHLVYTSISDGAVWHAQVSPTYVFGDAAGRRAARAGREARP